MTPRQRQRQTLDFIVAYQLSERGVSPSLQEIGAAVGLSPRSRGAVSALLDLLERQGHIKRAGARRDIVVIEPQKWLGRVPSHVLHSELERRDHDPAWQLGAAVCDCGNRDDSPEARDCQRHICPLRIGKAA